MEKNIMKVSMWILFLGGLFGFAMGMKAYTGGQSPAEYGVMGIGGGAYLFWSAIVAYLTHRK